MGWQTIRVDRNRCQKGFSYEKDGLRATVRLSVPRKNEKQSWLITIWCGTVGIARAGLEGGPEEEENAKTKALIMLEVCREKVKPHVWKEVSDGPAGWERHFEAVCGVLKIILVYRYGAWNVRLVHGEETREEEWDDIPKEDDAAAKAKALEAAVKYAQRKLSYHAAQAQALQESLICMEGMGTQT